MIARRIFVKDGALALVGMGMIPNFLYRAAMANPASSSGNKVLIVIFLRGGADGLNMVVPFREKEYFNLRRSIAVPTPSRGRDSVLDLDGFFGFHPSLQSLLPIYEKGHLAMIHAVGSPHATRSHFDAQDFMESGVPGNKSISDGWLNRYFQHNPAAYGSTFRGGSLQSVLPRSLKGEATAIALNSLEGFHVRAGRREDQARLVYERLYGRETDTLLSGTAKELFGAMDLLREADPGQYQPAPSAQYPKAPLARKLKQMAQLIKAEIGVEVGFVDLGGWDDHVNQGGTSGPLSNRLGQFSDALAAFYRDLGDRMEDVAVVCISEFGRTVRENGNGGTDHGHANVVFTMGGSIKGGKVYGEWPGLHRDRLFEGRDLAVTTDFRDVFSELLVRHLGCRNLKGVFPGFSIDSKRFKGFVEVRLRLGDTLAIRSQALVNAGLKRVPGT